MTAVLQILGYATTAGFLLLGAITLADFLRFRIASRGYLALAIGLIGLVSLESQFTKVMPKALSIPVSMFGLVGFMVAGYALLLFRDTLVPLKTRTKILVGIACAVPTVVLAVMILIPGLPQAALLPPAIVLFAAWCGTVGEPVVRLWVVAAQRPAVQKRRLRALSLGLGGIIMVLVIAIGGLPLAKRPEYQLGLAVLTILTIPVLYVSFAPPRWLRRAWREKEEVAFGSAIRDLLLYSPDRFTLSDRSLDWAIRLVGADSGLIIDDGGEILVTEGLEDSTREFLTKELLKGTKGVIPMSDSGGRVAITLPLKSQTRAAGGMAVVSGPFTPVFGTDEVNRLEQYAASFLTALDRVRLVETLAESEEAVQGLNRDLERRVKERTAQLEASNKELEAFSYTVSHDLRAPLRAIDGFSRILLEEYTDKLDDDGRRYVNLVSSNAVDMGKLIDGLLTFSRLSRQKMETQVVEPTKIAEKACEQLRVDLNGRNVEFTVNEMPAARSDPILLGQVYANLIGNAVKFSRDRDPAHIEVGCAGDDGLGNAFYVRDDGVGFDMKYADKLFGVFQRLHRSEDYEGTGAGLAIVQRIVHRHGGRVWAESEPGKGATFFFTLEGADAGS